MLSRTIFKVIKPSWRRKATLFCINYHITWKISVLCHSSSRHTCANIRQNASKKEPNFMSLRVEGNNTKNLVKHSEKRRVFSWKFFITSLGENVMDIGSSNSKFYHFYPCFDFFQCFFRIKTFLMLKHQFTFFAFRSFSTAS